MDERTRSFLWLLIEAMNLVSLFILASGTLIIAIRGYGFSPPNWFAYWVVLVSSVAVIFHQVSSRVNGETS